MGLGSHGHWGHAGIRDSGSWGSGWPLGHTGLGVTRAFSCMPLGHVGYGVTWALGSRVPWGHVGLGVGLAVGVAQALGPCSPWGHAVLGVMRTLELHIVGSF